MSTESKPFDVIRRTPSLVLHEATYDAASAFVLGFDLARQNGLLVGFREWLVLRLGYGMNLAWPALVLRCCFDRSIGADPLRTKDEHRLAIESMFNLIDQFLTERERQDGLRRILVAYDSFLDRQRSDGNLTK